VKKLLVVGCGSIGQRHAENAGKIAETAVFDVDTEVAETTATLLGVHLFASLDEGLSWGPDGVIVATPNHTHLEVARAAVAAGADVLIEKPISHNSIGVAEFLNEAEGSGRRVFVVCNMRFHPGVSALKEHLDRVGRPLYARAHFGHYLPNMRPGSDYRDLYCARRDLGGGVILDVIHELDYLMWFFGPVSRVMCEAATLSDLDIDVEDFACMCLRHENNVFSEIQMDYLRPFKRRGCEIVGDEGMLLWQSEGKDPEECNVRLFRKERGVWETLLHIDNHDVIQPYEKMLACFLDTLEGKETSLLHGTEAATELSIALSALKLVESNNRKSFTAQTKQGNK